MILFETEAVAHLGGELVGRPIGGQPLPGEPLGDRVVVPQLLLELGGNTADEQVQLGCTGDAEPVVVIGVPVSLGEGVPLPAGEGLLVGVDPVAVPTGPGQPRPSWSKAAVQGVQGVLEAAERPAQRLGELVEGVRVAVGQERGFQGAVVRGGGRRGLGGLVRGRVVEQVGGGELQRLGEPEDGGQRDAGGVGEGVVSIACRVSVARPSWPARAVTLRPSSSRRARMR